MKINKASLSKRIFAYIIDMTIVVLVATILGMLFPENNNITVLNQELNDATDMYFNQQTNFSVYFNQASLITKDLDEARIMYSVLNAILIFIYFIFIPYFYDGKTLGKKIFKIKTVRNDKTCLSLKNLVIKNMIDTGLLYMLVSIALIYILPGTSYFILTLVLSAIQLALVVASIIMIVVRKDKRGLNDILSETKVIEDNIEVEE